MVGIGLKPYNTECTSFHFMTFNNLIRMNDVIEEYVLWFSTECYLFH